MSRVSKIRVGKDEYDREPEAELPLELHICEISYSLKETKIKRRTGGEKGNSVDSYLYRHSFSQ